MKRILAIVLVLGIIFIISACDYKKENPKEETSIVMETARKASEIKKEHDQNAKDMIDGSITYQECISRAKVLQREMELAILLESGKNPGKVINFPKIIQTIKGIDEFSCTGESSDDIILSRNMIEVYMDEEMAFYIKAEPILYMQIIVS